MLKQFLEGRSVPLAMHTPIALQRKALSGQISAIKQIERILDGAEPDQPNKASLADLIANTRQVIREEQAAAKKSTDAEQKKQSEAQVSIDSHAEATMQCHEEVRLYAQVNQEAGSQTEYDVLNHNGIVKNF